MAETSAAVPDALHHEPALRERGLELLDTLGAGGTSVVYRARDARQGRDVAVKVLHRQLLGTPAAARFAQEVRVASTLQHPHILPVFDSGALSDGRLFTVMAVSTGRPLSDVLRDGPLPLADAMQIAHDTADALAYVHARGFVHRDVKPDNILIENGRATLTDFGIATPSGEAPAHAFASRPEGAAMPARPVIALGTLPYMCPEALRGDQCLDARADTYALGIVLYEMLTGWLPCEARTASEQLAVRSRNPLPRLRARRPDLPPALETLLRRCTEPRREDRLSSAAAIADALAAMSTTGGLGVPAYRDVPWRALAALGVVASLGIAAWGVARILRLDPNGVVVAVFVNDAHDAATAALDTMARNAIADAITEGTNLAVERATVVVPSRQQERTTVADSVVTQGVRALGKATRSGLVVLGVHTPAGTQQKFLAEVYDARSMRVLGVAGPERGPATAPDAALRALGADVVVILRGRAPTIP